MARVLSKSSALALNPLLTGPLHYILTRGPDKLRLPLLNFLSSRLSPQAIERLVKAIKYLWLFGLASTFNKKLNQAALSNWTWKSQKSKWHWEREIAVVTGGCSGIGKEIVKGLVAKGVRVAVLDVQDLPDEFQRKTKILLVYCDVTSAPSIADAAATVRAELGTPTILVNNAGVGTPHSIIDTPAQWVEKIFKINVISHFWLTREFLPAMVAADKGHVVGLASMASFVAPAGIVDYAATKAGVMAFHEGLSQETKHVYHTPGILNTIVHPSWVRTPLVGGYEDHLTKTQGRLMSPETIGTKVVEQIVSCRGGQLIIPSMLSAAAGLRGRANWLQEVVRDFAVGRGRATLPVKER